MTIKDRLIWYLKEVKTNHELEKVEYRPIEPNEKIKVGFLANMPEIWDKEKPVFESMVTDSDFEPLLIVTPGFDLAKDCIGEYGAEWDYFIGLYSEEYVVKAKTDGKYMDLKQFGFHYVFFQRPYEHYLIEDYSTRMVCKYARTCYIPYFFFDTKQPPAYYKTNFFRYLQFFFCCSDEQMRDAKTASRRKNIFLGYPAMEEIKIDEDNISSKAVLYTPRWAEEWTHETSFFRYKDVFPELKKTIGQQVMFRPHPLTFQNAIRTGRMTEAEVIDYKQRLTDNGILMDNNKDYMETFTKTGILVTDHSSIITSFFLTGKPIIFCTGIEPYHFSEIGQKVIKNFYFAKDWDDVIRLIKDLQNGIDPLKKDRLKCIEEIDLGNGSADRIKEYLKKQN